MKKNNHYSWIILGISISVDALPSYSMDNLEYNLYNICLYNEKINLFHMIKFQINKYCLIFNSFINIHIVIYSLIFFKIIV